MKRIAAMMLGSASVIGTREIIRRAYAGEDNADEVLYARTVDGWRLALSRYRPQGGATRAYPVLLCHGLASNRFAFDIDEGRSFALYLKELGFDVFSLELRGHGLSDRPNPYIERHFGWSFDDYLNRDLPAAISRVLEAANRDKLHFMGHSMGGILLFAYLSENPEAPFASGVTFASSLDYSTGDSGFHRLTGFKWLADRVPMLPLDTVYVLTAPLAGRVSNRMVDFNFVRGVTEPELIRRVHASAFHNVSTPVLWQMASLFETGGIRSYDSQKTYMHRVFKTQTPVLSIVGDQDQQCTPIDAKLTIDAMTAPGKELMVVGPEQGHQTSYGHFDTLTGRTARVDVWPRVIDHLERFESDDAKEVIERRRPRLEAVA